LIRLDYYFLLPVGHYGCARTNAAVNYHLDPRYHPPTVSHHLKILSEAGLIACRRRAQFVYSQAVPDVLEEYTRALLDLSRR
jgi:hypothetical protein